MMTNQRLASGFIYTTAVGCRSLSPRSVFLRGISRTKSVCSEEEFAALKTRAQARKLTLSGWVRAELEPRGGCGGAADEILLGRVLALRTILLNLTFSLSNGKQGSGSEDGVPACGGSREQASSLTQQTSGAAKRKGEVHVVLGLSLHCDLDRL